MTRYYSLLIVFQSLLFRIAELFIIAVIFRTVYVFSLPSVALSYQPSNVVQKPIFSKAIQVLQYVAITILGLLTFVAWVLLTTAYVYAIVRYPGSRFEYERLRESTKVGTAYQVIYFVCSITLLAATIISLGKSGASSKVSCTNRL